MAGLHTQVGYVDSDMISENERTVKYHLNRVHTALELIMRRPQPTNVPLFCVHEPTTGCNLRCPACPTGAGITNVKESAALEDYELCEEFGQYLDTYYLFSWGEATASKHLPDILKRLNKEPFYVHMSSNFSIPLKDELLDIFATMPRLSLQIDVDGMTQEIHEKSRVRSKLSIVMENAQRLSERIKVSATPPFNVFFGFLDFGYNSGELELVKAAAADLGFKFQSLGRPLSAGRPPEEDEITMQGALGCTWLYSSIAPTPGLTRVAPCCGVWDEKMMSPRAEGQSLHDLFMNDNLYQTRRTGDAAFATLSKGERIDHMRENIAREDGMGLLQAKLDGDICQRCSMGSSYQAKFPRIWTGAIQSLARLKGIDLPAAEAQLNTVINKIGRTQRYDQQYVDRLTSALRLPPAKDRNRDSYQGFIDLILELK
jgi:Radical SAM superfamily